MNQKELFEKEIASHHFYRGVFVTCLAFALFFSCLTYLLSLLFFNWIISIIFSWATFTFLGVGVLAIFQMGRLNLKWDVKYKLKEETKRGKTN